MKENLHAKMFIVSILLAIVPIYPTKVDQIFYYQEKVHMWFFIDPKIDECPLEPKKYDSKCRSPNNTCALRSSSLAIVSKIKELNCRNKQYCTRHRVVINEKINLNNSQSYFPSKAHELNLRTNCPLHLICHLCLMSV